MDTIAVLNVGGNCTLPRCRESMLAAASRWGCDYVEVIKPLADVHPYWQKVFVPGYLRERGYDRVLQLDADMLIRHDCPNPIDMVPATALGGVAAHRSHAVGHARPQARHWASKLGMEPHPHTHHLNAGLMVYSTDTEFFDEVKNIAASVGWDAGSNPEECVMSLLLWNRPEIERTWLPGTFNVTAAGTSRYGPQWVTPRMCGYIYHYTGPGKAQRVGGCEWQRCECDAIAERIPPGGSYLEVGVNDGRNAMHVGWRVPLSKLILVDTWGSDVAYTEPFPWPEEAFHNSMLDAAFLNTRPFSEIREVLIGGSAERVADGEVDVVYLAKPANVEEWKAKVKPGGWLGSAEQHDGFVSDVGQTWWLRVT